MAAALVTRLPSSTSSTPLPRKGAVDGHVERPNSFREGLHYASARRRRQQSGHGQKEGQASTEATHPVPAAGIPSVVEAKPRILQFHDDKAFMKWKIPERILNGSDAKSEPDQQSTEKPIRKSGQRSPKAKADVKDAETRNVAMTKVDNLTLNLNSQQHVTLATAAAKSTEQKTTSINNAEPRNATRKSLTIDQMLQKLFGPAGVDYQDAKTSYDRVGAVEKSSITDVAHVFTTITSLADVDTALHTWLRTANERSIRHASDFFKSLMASGPLRQGPAKHRELLQHVIDIIEANGYGKTSVTARDVSGGDKAVRASFDDCRLRYVRQLTPGTRAQRATYHTWHHLPALRHDGQNSDLKRSSVYLDAQRVRPSQYIIHPDWV